MEAEFILVWDGDMLAFNFHFMLMTYDLAFGGIETKLLSSYE
jgi:hypothetical protein